MNDKAVVGVAIGNEYTHRTDKMFESFLKYNEEWDVVKIYDNDVDNYLPEKFKNDIPFNKCEIGRWCAIAELLKKYKTVLYCDGDIYWYDRYFVQPGEISCFPHCINKKALSKYQKIIFTGVFNIGMMQFSGTNVIDLINLVIEDLEVNTSHYLYKNCIVSQGIPNVFPLLQYDFCSVSDPGYNVAHWNLKRRDRILYKEGEKWMIKFNDKSYPLRSFHFSGKCNVFVNDDEMNLVNDYKKYVEN